MGRRELESEAADWPCDVETCYIKHSYIAVDFPHEPYTDTVTFTINMHQCERQCMVPRSL